MATSGVRAQVGRDPGDPSGQHRERFRTEGPILSAQAEGLAEVWKFIDDMWTDRLGRLKRAAERAERRKQ